MKSNDGAYMKYLFILRLFIYFLLVNFLCTIYIHTMESKPLAIVINGSSCAGKTTLAKVLLSHFSGYLYESLDNFRANFFSSKAKELGFVSDDFQFTEQ